LAESITGRPKSAGKDLTMGLNRRQTKEVGRKTSENGMNYKKKLIEVVLPLDAINRASAREKSIRHGHPSTLHLWWARRPLAAVLKRFHGTVTLDPARVGRDASRIADEVIAHLSGLVGAKVTVTLEVEADIPSGAPDRVVRTVTENSRTLKFTSQEFEKE
jgi:hypothetical protein